MDLDDFGEGAPWLLCVGNKYESVLPVDTFRALDTTRIFAATTINAGRIERRLVKNFPADCLLNRIEGGKLTAVRGAFDTTQVKRRAARGRLDQPVILTVAAYFRLAFFFLSASICLAFSASLCLSLASFLRCAAAAASSRGVLFVAPGGRPMSVSFTKLKNSNCRYCALTPTPVNAKRECRDFRSVRPWHSFNWARRPAMSRDSRIASDALRGSAETGELLYGWWPTFGQRVDAAKMAHEQWRVVDKRRALRHR
ncbi:hypothetical protein BJQ90_03648 [Arthrobacter sp. SO3]|nr:hypothetical protein [Arthrobacter sp. SO3]